MHLTCGLRKLALVAASGACLALGEPKVIGPNTTGDGGLAIKAQIDGPLSIAFDQNDNLYVYQSSSDWIGIHWQTLVLGSIRRIDSVTHRISTIARGCNPPFEKHAPSGCIGFVSKIRVARSGRLLLSEHIGLRIRSLNPSTGKFSLIASNGGPGIAEDRSGDILIADSYGYVLRLDIRTGTMSKLAGTGMRGFSGDGGPAAEAQVGQPLRLEVDRAGNIYFSTVAIGVSGGLTPAPGQLKLSPVAGPNSPLTTGQRRPQPLE